MEYVPVACSMVVLSRLHTLKSAAVLALCGDSHWAHSQGSYK